MSPAPVYSNPSSLVPPVGPYSHLSRVGDLVYLAGQTGIDERGATAGPDISAQARKALENIRAALESQGLGLENILKLTTYVAGAEHLGELIELMDELFPQLFPGGCPPNTLLVVAQLVVPELRIEIDAVAHA